MVDMSAIRKILHGSQRVEPIPPARFDEPQPPALKESDQQEAEIMGKYLLRDMPMFKMEIILYFGMGVLAFMMYVVDKAGMVPGLLSKAIIPAIMLPIAFWMIKWMMYMPRKNKVPSLRIYKSGVIELGVDDISKGYITYGRGDHIKRKYITKLNRHVEASTGKPFLITSELQGENLNLLKDTKPDMRSEEFNAILETNTAVTTKNVMNKMMKFATPSLSNPAFIISLLTLFAVVYLAIKELGIMGG